MGTRFLSFHVYPSADHCTVAVSWVDYRPVSRDVIRSGRLRLGIGLKDLEGKDPRDQIRLVAAEIVAATSDETNGSLPAKRPASPRGS